MGLLDHRSIYGHEWFPEPLRSEEGDVGDELRLDYFHAAKSGRQFDSGRVEVEQSFGLLTVELASGYQSDRNSTFDPDSGRVERDHQEGFTNIEIGVRHPVYQYVSPDRLFDTTFVLGLEVSPPVLSKVSRDVEIAASVFSLTRLGQHLSVQMELSDSVDVGPEDRGLATLEYDVVIGYELDRDTLPLPCVSSLVPMLELAGEDSLNHDTAGENELFATAGVRASLACFPWLKEPPRLGIGYTFPLNSAARSEFHWGIATSIVFDF